MSPSDTAFMGLGSIAFTVICIGGSIVASLAVTVLAIVWVRKAFSPDTATLKDGLPAQAKILQISQTGTYVNMQPQVAMALEVTPQDGQPAYQTTTNMVIPMVNIPSFQPGAVFPAKINPKDRNKVVLDIYAIK